MKKTKYTQEADMVLDIKNLKTDGRTGANLITRTKNRIMAAIRSNEGLDKVVLNQFMIRHTNKDVHLAYFKIDSEAPRCGVEMPAPKGRGGVRGGGIASGGRFESLSQGSVAVQEEEDQLMRSREHAEKRKREGRQGGAEGSPPRRDSRFTNDSDSASADLLKECLVY